MKITKKGNWYPEELWVGKCRICDAEAEAMTSELKIHSGTSLSDYKLYATAKCPECQTWGSLYFTRKSGK